LRERILQDTFTVSAASRWGIPATCGLSVNAFAELRIPWGPGYRVYFVRHGDSLVILLAGGDKRTQARDILKARQLAREI